LTAARTAALGLAGSLQSSYDDTREKIGVEQDEVLAMIQAIKTGSTSDSNLRMAHDFLYGDGVYWEPLEDIINIAAGDVRSDLKTAINAVIATSREADRLLSAIDGLKDVVFGVVEQASEQLAGLETWNGNALQMAQNFCQETDGMGYLTDLVQLFRPREGRIPSERAWGSGGQAWSASNDPCDTFRKTVDGGYSYQRWPSMEDDAFGTSLAHALGYPAYAWGKGCRKGSLGNYDCGKVSGPGVRDFVDYLTSGLPDEVEALLNYNADALFAESKTVMRAARRAINKVIRLLNGFKTVLNSTGMDILIGTVSAGCTVAWSDCWDSLNGYRNQGVSGLSNAVTSSLLARADLDMAIGQHSSAKRMWKSPHTSWRVQANVYLTTLRNLNGPIQTPWTNSVSRTTCRAVFPKIPNSCLDEMIPESCHVTAGLVGVKEIGFRDPSDTEEWRRPGPGSDGGTPTALTALGSYGAVEQTGLFPGIKKWQVVALVGFGLYLWSERK